LIVCLLALMAFSVTGQDECETGWTPYDNSCYKVFSEKMSWDDARQTCFSSIDADLASITSSAERTFAWELVGQQTTWIGGNDRETEGTFTWSDWTPWDNQLWSPGNPDNSVNQDCVTMWDHEDGLLDDDNCQTKHQFICERTLPSFSLATDYDYAPPPVFHCSRQDPCGYGEGNCKRMEEEEWIHDDEACEDGLVCGVDNCGSFAPEFGYLGSCCVQASNSTFEMDDKPRVRSCLGDTEAVPGGYSEWGRWEQDDGYLGGWARQRTRVFWPRDDCRTFGRQGSTEVVCVTQRLQTERQELS